MAVDDNTTYGLTGAQIKDLVNGIESKQPLLTAGNNVQISNENVISATDTTYTAGSNVQISNENVISATDTTYSAGSGLDLTGTTFSVDTTEIQPKLTAGTNIDITGNEISATDTKYTAGTGLSLNGTQFSVDSSVVALQSDIPTVNDATLTIQKNGTNIDTFTANAATNKTINITVPTTAADVSALPASTKYGASLSLSINSSTYVVTGQLKDQDGNNLGTAQTIDLPLESVVVSGSYDSAAKEVVLTLQNGSSVRFSVADLVSGLQTEITSSNKLSADLVSDATTTNKFVTASDKTTWNGKQDALTAGSNIQINGTTISATDTTYSAFTGASSGTAGTSGLVPAPAAGDDTKFLSGDGLWKTVSQYSLPIASANDLGGIKVGANLTIDPDTGVLSADAQQVTLYTTTGQNEDGAMTQKATTDALALKADASAIPTVNNATLTIQKNGANVQTFTANSSSNKTANIVVPTKTSELTNDGDGANAFATVNNIPAAQVNSDWDAVSGVAQILNKPTIPTVNNATLTIQKNGTNVQTFTANSSTNKTANITVPTKTSELSNDSGFITNTVNNLTNYTLSSNLGAVATSNDYNDLDNLPTIPTVNNATLTIQHNGTSRGTFTANASSNSTVNIKAPIRVDLVGQAQTASYHRTVIGLCQVSGANTSINSYSHGFVMFQRDNGAMNPVRINVSINGQYSGDKYINFSAYSNLKFLSDSANIDTATGFRPCVFKYNNNWYGGIEFYASAANSKYVYFDGDTNFTNMFAVDYYSVAHDSDPGAVLNQEIYDSLDYTKWTAVASGIEYFKRIDLNDSSLTLGGGTYTATFPNKTGTVAMTSDLPTVNNATLTIQQNGTTVKTFTANASSNVTANITVPTKTSDLTNDSNFSEVVEFSAAEWSNLWV